jgi:hypothetical protein
VPVAIGLKRKWRKSVKPKGCPKGMTINDPHDVEQFAAWLGVSVKSVRSRLHSMPGVIRESRQLVRIIPRIYSEGRAKA